MDHLLIIYWLLLGGCTVVGEVESKSEPLAYRTLILGCNIFDSLFINNFITHHPIKRCVTSLCRLKCQPTTSWASIVPPPFPTVPRQFPDSSQIRTRQFRLGSNFYLRPALLFDYVPKITSKCIKIQRSCTSRFWPNIDFITAIEPLLQCRHLLLEPCLVAELLIQLIYKQRHDHILVRVASYRKREDE